MPLVPPPLRLRFFPTVGALLLAAIAAPIATHAPAQDTPIGPPTDAPGTDTLIAGEAAAGAGNQGLVDLDALIVARQVTTRCALYDSATDYLSPLADTAVRIRIEELEGALDAQIPDLADRISGMIAEANAVPCGHEGLTPFLTFAREVADDVTAIALIAWSEIEIDACSYFADDDFLAAVDRAQQEAQAFSFEGAAERRSYLEEMAGAWIDLFARNCRNLAFDPTLTLPGQVALALPRPDAEM